MNNNLTLSVTLTGEGKQLSGTLKNAQGEVQAFGGTTEREGARSERSLKGFGDTARSEGSKASRALRSTGNEVTTVSNHLNSMRRMATAALTTLVGFVGIRGISNEWSEIRRESELLERNLFRQQQLIETTGRTAERSAQQMLEQSRALALGTLQSTEGVMQAQQTLMTFRNIRGEVFDEAIEGALDLASAMGTDLNSTILQVAKALEDPVTGMTALTRSGTVFTAAQRDMVRGMVETNRTADAQAFILSELAAQYGGVAKAEAAGLAGAQDTIGQAMQEARLEIGEYLQVGKRLSAFYNNTATTIFQFNDALGSGDLDGHIRLMTTTAAAVGAAAGAYAAYRSILVAATVAQWAFNTAVRANPLGIAITLLGAAAGAMFAYRDEVTLAGKESFQTSLDVDGLTSSFHLLTEAQQENKRASLTADLIEMRVEAGRLGSELVEVSRKVRNSGQLTPQGGALPVATPEDIQKGRELRQELGMLLSDIDNGSQLLSEYDQAMASLGETTRDTDTRTRTLAETNAAASKAADELAKSTEAQADALEDLYDRLIPGRRETIQLARDIQTLNLAIAMGTGNIAQNIQMMGLLQQQFIEAQNDTDDLADKTVKAAFTMEGAFDELRLNGLRRLDDGFADLWEGAIDGSLNATDIMKRALDQTLAEMAHMAFTRPITVQLATSMGFGGTGAGGQQAGGGFNMGSVSSLKNGWDAVQGGFNGIQWGGASTSYSGGFAGSATAGMNTVGGSSYLGGSMQNFQGMQGLAGAGAGFAGSFAAGSVFGKSAEQEMGSTLGGLAGMYLGGPIGSALGSFLGGGLGSLVSHTPTKFKGEFVTRDSQFDAAGYSRDDRVAAMRSMPNQDFYYGGFYQQSQFGDLGFSHSGSQRLHRADGGPMDDSDLHERAEWGWELAEQAAGMDNFIASLAQGSDQIAVMRDAVQSLSMGSGDAAEIVQFALVDRSLAALDAAGIAISERFRSMNAEQFAQEMQQAVASVNLLSSASGRLNLQFDATSSNMLSTADNLAQMMGGPDGLANAQSQYYEAFFTDQEKFQHLTQDLTSTFGALGLALPDSREGVRSLVEGLDVMTDAGQRQLATIYQNVPALDQYVTAMDEQRAAAIESGEAIEDSAEAMRAQADIARERSGLERELLQLQGNTEELRRRELAGIDESNRALQERIWAINDERAAVDQATVAQQKAAQDAAAAYEQSLSGVESAYKTVEQAVNAERQILENAYSATTASISANISAVQDAMQATEGMSRSLRDALRDTQTDSVLAREQGQAALKAMLVAGEVTNREELEAALNAVSKQSTASFGSYLDYQRDAVSTAHDIYDLSTLTDEQLSVEEKSLNALDRQLETAEMQYQKELSRLDGLLASEAAQVEALFGQQAWLESINVGVLGVTEAIGALGGAISAANAAQATTAPSRSTTPEYLSAKAEQLNATGFEGRTNWTDAQVAEAFKDAGLTQREHYERYGQYEDIRGFDGSHANGLWRVPFDGYAAELHRDETVLKREDADEWRQSRLMPSPAAMPMPSLPPMPFMNQQSSSGGDMAVLVRRIEALTEHAKTQGGMQREALKALKALVRQLERWDDQDRVRVSVEATV